MLSIVAMSCLVLNRANATDSSDAPDAADLRDAVGGDFRPGVAGPAKGHA